METGSKMKIFDIKNNQIQENKALALPGFHAMSGCDTTSSFYGLGKSKCYKTMESDEKFIDAFTLLGEHESISSTVAEVLEEYVCKLYGFKEEVSINEVRYKMFTSKKKIPDPQKLPPTLDALLLHLSRVNYQVYEWKRALDTTYCLLNPYENGWAMKDNLMVIKWINNLPAPQSILEFVSCSCKKNECSSGTCKCFSVNLQCTSSCNCNQCKNMNVEDESDSDSGSECEYDSSDESVQSDDDD